jgi:hypothetical protein
VSDRRQGHVPWSTALRRSAPILGAGVLLSIAAAWHSVFLYLPTFNTPHTALEGVPHPLSTVPPTPGLSRHLALVVVDGLSFDAAHALPELAPLRRAGVFRPLHAEFPTYTSPALISFVTGVPPRDSGIRLNGNLDRGVPGLDSITGLATAAGVAVDIRSREWEPFPTLMHLPPKADLHIGRVGAFTELVTRRLPGSATLPPLEGDTPARKLTLFYIGEVDETAHAHGTLGPEHRDAAELAGSLVGHIARTLDLEQDALIIVSDHGHIPRGGHGGDEPDARAAFLLAAGAPIRKGVELGERPVRDVASTLALLAGLPTPGANLGRPMLDLLALGDRETAYLLAGPFDQSARFLCRLEPAAECAAIDALVDRLRHADPAARDEAEALAKRLGAAREHALAKRARDAARTRLAVAAALLVALAAAIAVVLRRSATRLTGSLATSLTRALDPASLALPVVNLAAYGSTLHLVFGYLPTFSTMKSGPGFGLDAIPSGLVAVGVSAFFIHRARPGHLAPWLMLALTAVPFALLAAWVGADPTHPPPPVEGILVFELAPIIVCASVGAAIAALRRARRPT